MHFSLRGHWATALVLTAFCHTVGVCAAAEATAPGPAKARRLAKPGPAHLVAGPMVGHTDPSSTRIWAKASRQSRLSVLVSRNADLSDAWRVAGPRLVADSAFMGTVLVPELSPSERYYYCLLLDGKRAMLPPYPSFSTAPPPASEGRLRVAFISCLGYQGYNSAAAWGDMTRTNFDLLLMLGDNHYANSSEPAKQRAAYENHRRVAGFRHLTSQLPTYAIWDDHDYGPDNSDSTLAGKERSLKTFREHWANPAYGEPDTPGIYYHFRRGPVEFFMLDDRYYRTPNKQTNAPGRTMLGASQIDWLKRRLLASTAPIKIIASGSEWQSHSTDDCWSNFKHERDELFSFIGEHEISGVILLSGDRHFTAAYQVAGRFIEVTSGPFGSSNATTKPLPEMFLYHAEGKLYCLLDIDTVTPEPTITLEIYRAGDGLKTRRAFTWSEIQGQTQIPLLKDAPKAAATKP